MLRTRVSGGGGLDGESSWDPSIPPEKQVVRYQTKTGEIKTVTKAELQEQLEQSEKIMSSLNESWEEKLTKTQEIQKERKRRWRNWYFSRQGQCGCAYAQEAAPLSQPQRRSAHVRVSDLSDQAWSDTSGKLRKWGDVHIKLSGTKILPKHCMFEHQDGVVTVTAIADSMTMVNGKRLSPTSQRGCDLDTESFLVIFTFSASTIPRRSAKHEIAFDPHSHYPLEKHKTRPWSMVICLPTRPDSPASGDVDWTYARREYAMAKLNGQNVNFDNLNEEDLEKLFEDISRARSKKSGGGLLGRPESRASLFDDNASESAASSVVRPYSYGAMTDDTSIDPWSQAGSEMGSMRLGGGTPMKEGGYNGYGMASPSPATTAASHRETESLRAKVREYEEKFTRLANGSPGLGSPRLGDGSFEYSDHHKALLRKAIAKWKSHTKVSMAADALSKAVLVKEANVISKELGKRVTYQSPSSMTFPWQSPLPVSNPLPALPNSTTSRTLISPRAPSLAWASECSTTSILQATSGPCPSSNSAYRRCAICILLSTSRNTRSISTGRIHSTKLQRQRTRFVASTSVPLGPLARQISTKYRLPLCDRHTGRSSVNVPSCSSS